MYRPILDLQFPDNRGFSRFWTVSGISKKNVDRFQEIFERDSDWDKGRLLGVIRIIMRILGRLRINPDNFFIES